MTSALESATATAAGERLYATAARLIRVLSPALGAVSRRFAAEIGARRSAGAVLAAWATDRRDLSRPLLWVHGASAGELLGAVPPVRALRHRLDFQLVVTYFSRSGLDAVSELAPDVHGHPPLDAFPECRATIDALRPDVIAFAAGDLWPGLTRAAARRRVGLVLINGSVRPDGRRLRPPARALLAPSYRRLRLAGAASEADAGRLRTLGVQERALRVTGDAAFDLALTRCDAARGARDALLRALGRPSNGRLLLVAGSTGPEDERVLLDAVARPELKERLDLVLVPHRPSPLAVARLSARCRERLGRDPVLWSRRQGDGRTGRPGRTEPEPREGRPMLVDTVGVLAALYTVADLAYVGGGFGRTGLHSVIEPAAAGIPVVVGPGGSRREADELIRRGAALRLDAGGLARGFERLVEAGSTRVSMGRRARAYVEEGAGAGQTTAELLLRAIERR